MTAQYQTRRNHGDAVLVTGSGTGFGQLTTQSLLEAGYTIFATMREPGGRNVLRAEELKTSFLSNMEMVADEARVASYGELGKIPEQMWGGFTEALGRDEALDAQLVADAILKVI